MNEAAAAQHRDNEPLDLGIEFGIELDDLAHARTTYSIEQFIAALEATATLTSLIVSFTSYEPTQENNHLIVEPLCRCLSNLRSRNEHHPLRTLTLRHANLCYHGMLDVLEQFLIAAKYGGIYHLKLVDVFFLPIQLLVEFCRNNNNLKVIEANRVSFSDGGDALSVPPNRTLDPSIHLVLDRLSLDTVSFENSAVTAFAGFISRMTVQALELGKVWASDDDDLHMTQRILSEIKIPSLKQLELNQLCLIEHFKPALEAGTTSLIELHVYIDYDNFDCTERLELLANFIRRAVQLNSLKIRILARQNERANYSPFAITQQFELFRAIAACATITQIEATINDRRYFGAQSLEFIRTRNEELASFIACPSTYPKDKWLGLLRQFVVCPTGRYMLVRCLPEVLSFEKTKSTVSPMTASKPKERKTDCE